MTKGNVLPLQLDELAACVSCGLCLAHCPTYRVTGEEARSPRGRIAAMRAVEEGAALSAAFADMMQTCVMCRACETACPSAVPFGRLMEATRTVVPVPWWQRMAYSVLSRPRLLMALTAAGAIAQRARLMPRMGLPRLPVRRAPLRPTGDDVWLFTGCVMDAWQRPVHQAALDVLTAMGVGVALPGPGAACCGALHAHAGRPFDVHPVISAMPGDAPILVDSAGCGAALKDYADASFAGRVYDIQEWIAVHADRLPPPQPGRRRPRVAVQDPCHLRHVQRAEGHVRTVLRPFADLIELGDDGRCCGAGGAYSILQPTLARAIREDKLTVIAATGADLVASANPGCMIWLASAGVTVLHPMEIVKREAGL